jgi:hypothetical protein
MPDLHYRRIVSFGVSSFSFVGQLFTCGAIRLCGLSLAPLRCSPMQPLSACAAGRCPGGAGGGGSDSTRGAVGGRGGLGLATVAFGRWRFGVAVWFPRAGWCVDVAALLLAAGRRGREGR